jgi:[protein-PII] uridylyltransferase
MADVASQFIASMPAPYRNAFTESEAEEHASIVLARGTEPARAVVWRSLPEGIAIMCVVADDRPGLVALVSAAFVAHGVDVCSAEIYCRERPDGGLDAVDFFWVRALPSSSRAEAGGLDTCARAIEQLVANAGASLAMPEAVRGGDPSPDVSFAPASSPGQWQLSVRARDFPGLLHTITRLLHEHGLTVVRSEVHTEGGQAEDRFVVAGVGELAVEARLAKLRSALIDALVGAPPVA